MLYFSCDMVNDRCNSYFSFWAIFYPFTAQKIKIKKKKKCQEISSFYMCTKNGVQFLRYGAQQIDR